MRSIKIAYIGSALPNTEEYADSYRINAAGCLANLGIVEALASAGLDVTAISQEVVPYYPHGKDVFKRSQFVQMMPGARAYISPLINIFPVREWVRSMYLYYRLVCWAIIHRKEQRVVVVYNMFSRGVRLRLLTKLLGVKLVPIVFDWFPLSGEMPSLTHRIVEPMWRRRLSLSMLTRCDGLFAISQNIARDFASCIPFQLIDGGVGQTIIKRLFPLCEETSKLCEETSKSTFDIVFAGGLRAINHIDILLAYMRRHRDPELRLHLAGSGETANILAATKTDPRIIYHGMLTFDQLMALYRTADVLVSLRDLKDPMLRYHFPSKTLEMLAMGRPFITTNSSHTKDVYGGFCEVLDECSLMQFEQAMQKFLRMSARDRMEYGKRAREFILRERTWAAQGIRMRAFLEKLCAVTADKERVRDEKI